MAARSNGSFKPGQVAPKSGQIQQTDSKTEKTIVQGDRFPPTSKPGQTYKYVDLTKHKKP
jgi:hypothetical protein